jgi:hypothetical protein
MVALSLSLCSESVNVIGAHLDWLACSGHASGGKTSHRAGGIAIDRTLRCHHCGDVIGVYEPMIMLADGQARNTSRATEPLGREPVGECYHRACYSQAHGQDHRE